MSFYWLFSIKSVNQTWLERKQRGHCSIGPGDPFPHEGMGPQDESIPLGPALAQALIMGHHMAGSYVDTSRSECWNKERWSQIQHTAIRSSVFFLLLLQRTCNRAVTLLWHGPVSEAHNTFTLVKRVSFYRHIYTQILRNVWHDVNAFCFGKRALIVYKFAKLI